MNSRVQEKKVVLFSSIFTLFSLFFLSPTIYSKTINPKIVTGIYSEDLPPPVPYETYISVVLEYVTPKFKPIDITFNNWYNCTSEKYPYSLSCPVVFHLNNAMKNFHTDFESIQPGKDDENYEKSPYFDRLLSSSDFCHRIQTHFPDIYTNSRDLEKYLDALKRCSIQELFLRESMDIFGMVNNAGSGKERIYIERNITDFTYNVRAPFTKMETNFYDAFYKPVANASAGNEPIRKLASAALSNSRTALQGSLLAAFYAERNRWMHAISSCHSHRLPQSLVNETRIRSILSNLNLSVDASSYYEFSIPLDSMSSYFSLPLTDCTHTADSFVVRLLVPVISVEKKEDDSPFNVISLRSVRNVPFLLNEQKICTLKGIEDRATFLTVGGAAYETKCRPNELCDISPSSLSSSTTTTTSSGSGSGGNLCMSLIFANKIEEFVKYCEFECRNPLIINPPFPPIFIQRISNTRFILMGRESVQITCQLNDNQSETFDITLEELPLGVVELEFFCNCELFLPSPPNFHQNKHNNNAGSKFGQVFRSGNSNECRDSGRPFYQIFQLVPWHFLIKEKQLECLTGIQRLLNGSEEEEHYQTASISSDYQPVDLEILSDNIMHIIDLDIINRLVSSNSSDHEQLPHGEKIKADLGGLSGSGFNWTVFFLVLTIAILCIGQILLFYQMNQIRETPYFSLPSRVLYRTTTTGPALIAEENE